MDTHQSHHIIQFFFSPCNPGNWRKWRAKGEVAWTYAGTQTSRPSVAVTSTRLQVVVDASPAPSPSTREESRSRWSTDEDVHQSIGTQASLQTRQATPTKTNDSRKRSGRTVGTVHTRSTNSDGYARSRETHRYLSPPAPPSPHIGWVSHPSRYVLWEIGTESNSCLNFATTPPSTVATENNCSFVVRLRTAVDTPAYRSGYKDPDRFVQMDNTTTFAFRRMKSFEILSHSRQVSIGECWQRRNK